MKQILIKYQHYCIILLVLIVANYVTLPLWERMEVFQQDISMQQRQLLKSENLVDKGEDLDKQLNVVREENAKVTQYMFNYKDESEFKIYVQQKVEKIITNSQCEIELLAWKNEKKLTKETSMWELETRIEGAPVCVVKVTRAIESSKPLIRIGDFNFRARRITGAVRDKVSIVLQLFVFNTSTEASK
ncbi:hypothetical protein [Thalassotalea sediminis]|uniref:hypothetical protein n=1 Tax=Thalassotalea sediminis TaxID=1759089 RepID=UPI0025738681|nr:hypothetical protein [Thalassotalea sediminis]